jgi:hypothetical protein
MESKMNIFKNIFFILTLIMIYTGQSSAQWILKNHSYNHTVNCLITYGGSVIYAGFEGDSILMSSKEGSTWEVPAWIDFGLTNHCIRALAVTRDGVSSTSLLYGTWGSGIFRTKVNSYELINENKGLQNLFVTTLFAPNPLENDSIVFAGTWGGVFYSSDAGRNWNAMNSGLTNLCVRSILHEEWTVFVGTFVGTVDGLFRSSDVGAAWTPINQGLTNTSVTALERGWAYLFAGTSGGGIFRSSDNGTN